MPEVSVALLPGDGIGPEVIAEARRVVDALAPDHGLSIDWHEHLMGGVSIDAHGTALTDEVLEACRASDAVLLGAVACVVGLWPLPRLSGAWSDLPAYVALGVCALAIWGVSLKSSFTVADDGRRGK